MLTGIKNLYNSYKNSSVSQQCVYLFCAVLLLGLVMCLLLSGYHLLKAHNYYPYVYFLYDPRYIHSDFIELYDMLSEYGLYIYQGSGTNYPPFLFLVLYPLSFLSSEIALRIIILIFAGTVIWLTYKFLPKLPHKWLFAGIFILCNFPFLFVLNRGNIEMLLFVTMTLFLLCYKNNKLYWAAFFLALAINLKIYPAVFILLFLSEKKFKPFLTVCLWTVTLFLTGFYITGGNLPDFLHGFQNFTSGHQYTAASLQFSNSLFNLVRFPLFFLTDHSLNSNWDTFINLSQQFSPYYFVIILFLSAFLFLRLCLTKMPFWQKIFLLALAQITFPFVSYIYTLTLLILPILFFFQEVSPDFSRVRLVALLSALSLVPFNIVFFNFATVANGNIVITAGSFIRPCLLLILFILLLRPLPKKI